MSDLQQYIVETFKKLDNGTHNDTEDPADPAGIGDPLSQEEIDFVKRFINEIKNRYPAPPAPSYLPEDEPTGPPAP